MKRWVNYKAGIERLIWINFSRIKRPITVCSHENNQFSRVEEEFFWQGNLWHFSWSWPSSMALFESEKACGDVPDSARAGGCLDLATILAVSSVSRRRFPSHLHQILYFDDHILKWFAFACATVCRFCVKRVVLGSRFDVRRLCYCITVGSKSN